MTSRGGRTQIWLTTVLSSKHYATLKDNFVCLWLEFGRHCEKRIEIIRRSILEQLSPTIKVVA